MLKRHNITEACGAEKVVEFEAWMRTRGVQWSTQDIIICRGSEVAAGWGVGAFVCSESGCAHADDCYMPTTAIELTS